MHHDEPTRLAATRAALVTERDADLAWHHGRLRAIPHLHGLTDADCRAVLATVLTQASSAADVAPALLAALADAAQRARGGECG